MRKPGAPDSQLKALRGPLGWVITGTVQGAPTSKEINVNFTSYDKKLYEQVDNFWKLEAFGTQSIHERGADISDNKTPASNNLSREDMRAAEILQRTTKMSGGHYETGLLLRNEEVKLPNNRSEGERRLWSLKRRSSRE